MRDATCHPNARCLGTLGLLGASPTLDRQACTSTVRYVFGLIWPQAGIECHAGESGCLVDVWQAGLHHAVNVPWALVAFDHGLVLVRTIYRADLPGAMQGAAAGLSLSL